ncbi:hypothetical protein MNV49_003241 [Pseudohyphozyma bogoriensis]|nr:hypothetical protein MNV49_003241 [Pseudohyphozyma bogoriensis]
MVPLRALPLLLLCLAAHAEPAPAPSQTPASSSSSRLVKRSKSLINRHPLDADLDARFELARRQDNSTTEATTSADAGTTTTTQVADTSSSSSDAGQQTSSASQAGQQTTTASQQEVSLATGGSNKNKSSSTAKTWGIVGVSFASTLLLGVVGGVVIVIAAIFVVWRCSQRRFSDDDDVEEIKWPELQPDGQTVSASTSTLNPLGTRRTGGAGIGDDDGEMSEWGGEKEGTMFGRGMGVGPNHNPVGRRESYEQLGMYDSPSQTGAYYDPYLGASSAPYPPPQNIYPPPGASHYRTPSGSSADMLNHVGPGPLDFSHPNSASNGSHQGLSRSGTTGSGYALSNSSGGNGGAGIVGGVAYPVDEWNQRDAERNESAASHYEDARAPSRGAPDADVASVFSQSVGQGEAQRPLRVVGGLEEASDEEEEVFDGRKH